MNKVAKPKKSPPSSRPVRQRDGTAAENLAAEFLTMQGLHLLGRNYRIRGGEIDLICLEGQTLVFVEVRLRRSPNFGGAAASIDWQKRQRLILAAQHYLLTHPAQQHRPCRFDCVCLTALSLDSLEWISDAFDLVYD